MAALDDIPTNEFKWTDELVSEFALNVKIKGQSDWVSNQMVKFKESKQPPLDYEIISYKREWNDNIHSAKDLENIKHDYPIYSVRRLSDSEIFTIGDITTKGIIHSFEIHDGWLGVNVGDQNTLLRTFDKIKTQPLFTTEQEKEIIHLVKKYLNTIT